MPEERTQESAGLNGRSANAKEHAGFDARARDRPHVCPACGHASVDRFLYAKNGCDILCCGQCGLGRAETTSFNPKSYYTGDYFSGKRSDGYADYVGTEHILRREFAGAVKFIRSFRASGRLLEVGCAYGFLLLEAKPFFDVSGIELAADAAEHCRRTGLTVFTGPVDEYCLGRLGAVDVIVLLDVIEHLPSPRDTIALLVNHLSPGGLIVITTGDFGSVHSRVAGAHWRLMTPPQHLWFFSQRSMRAMARSLGLETEHVDHPWKLVPLSLIGFQLARMAGLAPERIPAPGRMGIPLNLFDAMRVVLRKPSR